MEGDTANKEVNCGTPGHSLIPCQYNPFPYHFLWLHNGIDMLINVNDRILYLFIYLFVSIFWPDFHRLLSSAFKVRGSSTVGLMTLGGISGRLSQCPFCVFPYMAAVGFDP